MLYPGCMCGIAGKVSFTNTLVQEKDVRRMTAAIAHRGPDGERVYISADGKMGLGHRRLAIIDLSPAGAQPMQYKGRYWITFNGEIYNYQEERRLLEKKGYRFVSQSDTEVILALYDAYQEKCLDHLRGMFAFALYDAQEQKLFCARDRLGKKPFKYHHDGRVFIFASELKAILTQPEYKREPDSAAIDHYLTLQYCPAPLTGFKSIAKLEPGHYLKIDIKTGGIEKKRYWQLDFSRKLKLSQEEWQGRILEELREATRLRLIADVPLGAFLSGGLDSSTVVGLMSQLQTKQVKTFSIGFGVDTHNELPYARQVADYFHTDHTEFVVTPKALEILPVLVRQYEEPFADSSAIPSWCISQLTRQHVTVALNGDGGDENFAGYDRYSIQKFALWYGQMKWLHGLGALSARLVHGLYPATLTDRALRFTDSIIQEYRARYLNYIRYFPDRGNTAAWLAAKFQTNLPSKLDQTLAVDIETYLPNDLLVKMDMATMAHSLEGRSPFLDHRFMELCAQIPIELKLQGLTGRKYILRQALKKLLPAEIINRPKHGFSLPIAVWLRGELKSFAYHTLRNNDAGKKLLDEHTRTRINYAPQIWALLMLELWQKEYFT